MPLKLGEVVKVTHVEAGPMPKVELCVMCTPDLPNWHPGMGDQALCKTCLAEMVSRAPLPQSALVLPATV